MIQDDKQMERTSDRFNKQKHKLPKDICWKLQYMHDYIYKQAKPFNQLTQAQKNQAKDIEDLSPRALKIVFASIVNSILTPNLYCSFQKNCRIKIEGMMPRWIKVYISFNENQILFSNRKKILKFVIEGLECHRVSDLQLQFKYKKVRKLKIRFQHVDAARNMQAKISQLIQQNKGKKKKQSGQQKIIISKDFQHSLNNDFVKLFNSKQATFYAHKTQPKIHVTMFMQGYFWDIFHLAQFVITQRFWNSKVKDQKFTQHESKKIYVERRYNPSSFLSLERRTFTSLRLKQINESCFTLEQQNEQGIPTSKSIVLSDIHTKITLDILSPKIVKVTIDSTFNARGYCNRSSSREMLIDLFSDVIYLQDKYVKLKQRGKLHFKLFLGHKIISRSEQTPTDMIASLNQYPKKRRDSMSMASHEVVKQQQNGQAYYSIMDNKKYTGIQDIDKNQQEHNNTDQFYDFDDQFDTEIEQIKQKRSEEVIQQHNVISSKLQNPQQLKKQQAQITSDSIKQFQSLKPANYDQKISIEYVKLIKLKIFERAYLNYRFSESELKNFPWETPWYDPSIIIPSGNQYQVSNKNQLIFINYDLIRGQKDSLLFVLKQVGANLISGKSVLNVSLPVDIFQSRSLLERSAASFACAPKYLKPIANSDIISQIKSVIGFMLSVCPLQLIMLKPFNPILGETFQAYIGGIPIYYEQISHHPPISSYYMSCDEFILYGNLQAVANVSLNSATGGNAGKMHIIMKNGNHFQISFFPAQISGLIYGKRKYSICHKAFVFERKHSLVAEISAYKQSKGLYQWKTLNKNPTVGDLIGGVFKVKQKFLTQNPTQKTMMYHSGLKKTDIEQKIDSISGLWFSQVSIGDEVINKNKTAYPVQYSNELLPSDSNFRLDILMHRLGDLARSQNCKQILQGIQRKDRKLREQFEAKKDK